MTNRLQGIEQKKLYFGYGSNMWKNQMRRRCPHSNLVGVGVLQGWKWIINNIGSSTIIPSPEDTVYGLLYEISQSDEETLDTYERHYIKKMVDIDTVKRSDENPRMRENQSGEYPILSLTYIDVERATEGPPAAEYVVRMNHAIKDALEEGVPMAYIRQYLRPFIPEKSALARARL